MRGDSGDVLVTPEGTESSIPGQSRGLGPSAWEPESAPPHGFPRQYAHADDLTGTALAASPGVNPVAEASAAIGAAVDRLSEARRYSTWLRDWGLHLEVLLALVAGLTPAFVMSGQPAIAVAAVAVWTLGNFHRGRAVTTPLTRQLKSVGTSALLPLAMLAGAVGFFGVSRHAVPEAFTAVTAAGLTSMVVRTLRWRLQAPVRVVVAGDRAAIATAVTRWAQTPHVQVVGGFVVEADLAADAVPLEILGVPTVVGLDEATARIRGWQGDLLVVDPGAGISTEVFRRLTWRLEASGVAIGVIGVLESVAPHRVRPGGLGTCGILDVRSPRPSRIVRYLKSAADRVGALVLLFLTAPVLLAMVAAVKLDSRGPAFFRQTRVGRGGRPFTVYKMRTMVANADDIKPHLADANEFDSVLFKIREDPRVTRIGRVLRKTSLDELPQLLNVLQGDMSLVGPRPHLPDEIESMDDDHLRRLAVKPGITGLWQVSGRSDLPFDKAVELDTYYADNWSLTADLRICLGTVKAVLSGRGAY